MRDLFRSEWRRFRRLALGTGIAHLLALALMSRAVDVTELGTQDQAAILFLYMVLALTLAVLQVGSYRSASRWLWLIHRPLAPGRIFAALALSAAAMLGLAILAPLVVFLAGLDALTTHVVDGRHYGAAVHGFAFAAMAWFAGAHACTSRHRAAVAILLAPLMLALQPSSVWALLPLVLACVAWMAFVARHGFRADRDAPIARHGVLLVTALPLQVAFFFLVFHAAKGGIALAGVVSRGNTGRTVATGDPLAAVEAEMRRSRLALWTGGLAGSTDPRVAGWRAQLEDARMAGVAADIERFPVRHQLGNDARPWWDGRRMVKWTFSHDAMMYHGRHPGTGASRGWWGRGGSTSREPFAEVPTGPMTASALYAVNRDTTVQRELVRLPPGERFIGRPTIALDRILLLTDRRLLAFGRPRDTLSLSDAPTLHWAVPIADRGLTPITVDVAEVEDGWLVSLFYFDDREYDGFEFLLRPWQRVVHVDAAGRATPVNVRRDVRDRRVNLGITSPVPVASWWVSPPIYALAHVPDLIDSGSAQRPRLELLPRVPALIGAGAALLVLSTAAAGLWLRRARVTMARRRLWLAACALVGLPAFLSMICLEPRRSRCD